MARGSTQWDGSTNTDCTLDYTDLQSQNIDLTDGGNNAGLLIRVISSDGVQVDIKVKIYTNSGNWGQRSVAFASAVSQGQVVDLFLPFASFANQVGDMDETHVGAVELELDGTVEAVPDMTIKLVKATGVYE